MNREKVTEFVNRFLNTRPGSITNEWVNICCPFAGFRHKSGKDSHPSFGISYGGHSFFKCYTCSHDALPLISLPFILWLNGNPYMHDAVKFILDNEPIDDDVDKIPTNTVVSDLPLNPFAEKAVKTFIPQEIIDIFPSVLQHKNELSYLVDRRLINLITLLEYKVKCDPIKNLIIFPLTNHKGDIKVLRARRWRDKKLFTISPGLFGMEGVEFPSLAKDGVWFGLHRAKIREPVVLVESEIDALRLSTLGYTNSIASCSSNVTAKQLSNIQNKVIILGYDSDLAGEKATKHICNFYNDKIIYKINWDLVGRKDAGDVVDKEEMDFLMERKTLLKTRSKFNVQKNA